MAEIDRNGKSFWAKAVRFRLRLEDSVAAEKNGLAGADGPAAPPRGKGLSVIRSGRTRYCGMEQILHSGLHISVKQCLLLNSDFKCWVKYIGFMPDMLNSISMVFLLVQQAFLSTYWMLSTYKTLSDIYPPKGKTDDWLCLLFVGKFLPEELLFTEV